MRGPDASDPAFLIEGLASDDRKHAKRCEQALARMGAGVLDLLRERLADARPPLRGRLARIVARLLAREAGDPAAAIAPLLDDPDPKTRRGAVLALGRVRSKASEAALLAYWERDHEGVHRRPVAEALGKVGGGAALAKLRAVQAGDADLRSTLDVAILRLERSAGRGGGGRIDVGAPPPSPLPVELHCREGLEAILAGELGAGARARAPGRVEARLAGPLRDLFLARTWTRVGFPIATPAGALEDAVVRALVSDEARRVFEAFGRGPVRFRIAFASGGHRRALVHHVATRVRAERPDLVNDPTASAWEALVDDAEGAARVVLCPRRFEDPRFAWRRGDVPAASHPTIAAALARVAGVDPDAVVWDPFVGSGLELVERALAGPYRALHGTDRDPRALAVAAENLRAAGVAGARLARADATRHVVPGVTLVLTNPPMGRRLEREGLEPLLDGFVDHVARSLAPGGKLVWITPLPERTSARSIAGGLEETFRQEVEMGGFRARMEAWWKPTGRASARRPRGGSQPGS